MLRVNRKKIDTQKVSLLVADCLLFADKTRVPLVKRVYALGMKDGTGG